MTTSSRTPRSGAARGRRLLALSLPLFLVVATACSKKDDSADVGQGGGPRPTAAPTFFPLTGLQATDAAVANRPAVTVKIENSPQSRPQSGLNKADVVIEAVVEGGQTRFLSVFHSDDADPVGPVRSVRPGDPSVVAPFGGVVAYSGGIPVFVQAMQATGLTNIDENNAGDAFQRRSGRAAPHNLYSSTSALRERADGENPPPKFAEFLKPDQAFAPPGATPVTRIDLAMGRTTSVAYDWDAGSKTWKRSVDGVAHNDESGEQLAPTTVIVQSVTYQETDEVDTSGTAVNEAGVVGSGDAVIFANGMMFNAKWSKPSASAMTTWTDPAGAPVALPAGRTWVELPENATALTTG